MAKTENKKPKGSVADQVRELAQPLAASLGLDLWDVRYVKEGADWFLRIFIDKPEGVDLNDCERYHRAIQPQLESYDYDLLEISSPGIDRPLKKDRDFERAMGMEVELRLFKAVDGQKEFTGELVGYDKENVVLLIAGEEKSFARKAASLIKPVVDMDGVQEVDLHEDETEVEEGTELEIEE